MPVSAPQLMPSHSAHSTKSTGKTSRRSVLKLSPKGLKFEHVFSNPNVAPFDEIPWELRTAEINDDTGKAIFKQENIEVPKSWSPLATKIAVSKYFYGEIGRAHV